MHRFSELAAARTSGAHWRCALAMRTGAVVRLQLLPPRARGRQDTGEVVGGGGLSARLSFCCTPLSL